MNVYNLLFLLAVIPSMVLGWNVNARSCRNDPPTPRRVNVVGCLREPCSVRRGSTVQMNIDFTTDRRISSITPSVRTTVLGITTNYALPGNLLDSCQALAFPDSCPLRANRRTTVRFRLPINKMLAPVEMGVQLTLTDQDGFVINCFSVNLKVRLI